MALSPLTVAVALALMVSTVASLRAPEPTETANPAEVVSKRPSYDSPSFQVNGRTALIKELNDAIAFDFSGVTLRFEVTGVESISLALAWRREHAELTNAMPHRFNVAVNGVSITPFSQEIDISTAPVSFPPKFVEYLIASRLLTSERYVVEVQHTTEPNWALSFTPTQVPYVNWVAFGNVTLRGPAPVFHPIADTHPQSTRRIEFIGDSITAAYGNLCHHFPNVENVKGYELESFYYSWANEVCVLLGATCHTEAWSGMGMMRNSNLDETVTMPDLFNRALGSDPESKWNFSQFVPDVVVINLGTNDWVGQSRPFGFVEAFVDRYVNFVKNVSNVYEDTPTFFLACGPMSNYYCPAVAEVLERLTALGIPAHFLDHRSLMTASTTCSGHPDANSDYLMSLVTRAAIESAMGWTPVLGDHEEEEEERTDFDLPGCTCDCSDPLK